MDRLVREEIASNGPMPYAEVVELALYHPDHGFYTSGGQAGRRGDFLTSPEVGPLFGHLVANALDAEWDRLDQPEVFTVIDYGAGPGTLARSVLAAKPRCALAMRYIAVERSVEQRAQHPEPVLSTDYLAPELIGEGVEGVVIANELLDNMAFTPMRMIDGAAVPATVTIDEDNNLQEHFAPDQRFVPLFEPVGSNFGDKSWVDQTAAGDWMREMLGSVLRRGRVIVIDYARRQSDDVEVRTYAAHGRAGNPLEQLGTKDITVDVDMEQLQQRVGLATAVSTQAEWLSGHGIEQLVDEGRRIWEENAAVGDLAALRARSRIREAEALLEPVGLGGFLVAEWMLE